MNRAELIGLQNRHRASRSGIAHETVDKILTHLIEQTPEPEYPLWFVLRDGRCKGSIYEFTSLNSGTVIQSTNHLRPVGWCSSHLNHKDDCWIPCEKPDTTPEPLVFTGEPVWAWVGNKPDDYKNKLVRQVVAHKEHFTTMEMGKSNLETSFVFGFEYAWRIPEGEE